MGKQAAEDTRSTDEQLFSGALDGLSDLIIVDAPEQTTDDVRNEIDEDQNGGGGDPAEQHPPVEKQTRTGNENLITVDTGEKPVETTDTKTQQGEGDTDDTKSKEGKKAGKDEENLSPMYLHAAALQEDGLLPDFDLESIKTLETKDQIVKVNQHIQQSIEKATKEAVDNALSGISEVKQMYEDIKNGVDREQLSENMSLEEQYGKISAKDIEDDVEAQEQIYSNYLYMKGFSDSKVKQLVNIAKENETLLNESTDGLKEIQSYIRTERENMRREAETRKKDQEKRAEETKERVRKVVSETKEIIPGMELSKAEQEQLIKDMMVPVKYETGPDGIDRPVSRAMELRSKDPIFFEMRLNYFIQNGFFDKDSKFSKFMKKNEKNAASKFFDKVNKHENDTSGKPRVEQDKEKSEEFIFPQGMM